MSTANSTILFFAEEDSYGTQATGTYQTLRFTGESLSYKLKKQLSAEISADRQISDIVITDADLDGGFNFELSYSTFDELISAALQSDWATQLAISSIGITFATSGTISVIDVEGPSDEFELVEVGQFIKVMGSSEEENNTYYRVASKTDSSEIVVDPVPAVAKTFGPITAYVDESEKVWTAHGDVPPDVDQKVFGTSSLLFDGDSAYLSTQATSDFDFGVARLGTWANRLRLVIDSSKIDETLTNFPVMLKLSTSSGISSADISAIFDELGSDANRKKIAVTSSDGTTQLYVEIELWDDANEQAWLHVKVPSITHDADTILFLYYDSAQDNNTDYVGDTTDAVTHNVWDDNFKAVYHLAQDPDGDGADAIKDSTVNAKEMTPYGSMTTADLVDGKVGKCVDFELDNYYYNLGVNITSLPFTLESIAKTSSVEATKGVVGQFLTTSVNRMFYSYLNKDNYARCRFSYDTQNEYTYGATQFGDDEWVHIAFVCSNTSDRRIFTNGLQDGINTVLISSFPGSDRFSIGAQLHKYPTNVEGTVDEVRVSDIARSAAWIKATYNSLWDSLITFPQTVDASNGKFTIDFRFRLSSFVSDYRVIQIGSSSKGVALGITETAVNLLLNGDAFSFANSPSLTTWYHIAIARDAANLRAFINGTQIGSTATAAQDIRISDETWIGRAQDGYFNGLIDELRISNGVARWTANFTSPTEAYTYDADDITLLHCDDVERDSVSITGSYIRNGVTKKSYSIIREHNALTGNSNDSQYFNFVGLVCDTFSLSLEAGSLIKGDISFLGKSATLTQSSIYLNDPTDPTDFKIMNTATNVAEFLEDGESTDCLISSFIMKLANNLRGKKCLTELGNCCIGVGKCDVSGTIEVYFKNALLYNKYVNGESSSIVVRLLDNSGNAYIIDFPKIKFNTSGANVGGVDQSVMQSLSYTAVMDSVYGYTIQISKFDV